MGVMPVILLLTAFYPALSSLNSYGKDFIMAFPENIAYYHPSLPQNRVQVTALHGSPRVTLSMGSMNFYRTMTVTAGQMKEVDLPARRRRSLELDRSNVSSRTLRVTSSGNITVHAVSQRLNSVQTMLVPPTESLGREYRVPPILKGKYAADLDNSLFRLIVINAGEENKVTISREKSEGNDTLVSLDQYEIFQLLINDSQSELRVSANHPVAALFSHPCADVGNCTCRMLVTSLTPTQVWGSRFLLPPIMADDAENDTYLMLTANQDVSLSSGPPEDQSGQPSLQSAHLLPFYPGQSGGSSLVKTTHPVSLILHRPSMLLSIIPHQDFSSCFLLHSLPNVENKALLVVKTEQTDGVHLGKDPLTVAWNPMEGTEHSWALVNLDAGIEVNVIWHTSTKMAAYYVGVKGSTSFGNPALSLSRYPDSGGCLLRPEVLAVGEEDGWPESLVNCRSLGLQLISLNTDDFLQHVTKRLKGLEESGQGLQVWIGLRRSSLTGEWYWISKASVEVTNWDVKEPGSPTEGQCAAMSLDSKKDFTWSDESCCKELRPLCYRMPIYFPLG